MTLSLPADILLVMLSHLDIKDVLNFRKTCKDFYGLSKSRSIWESLLRRCIIEQDIPLPGLRGRTLDSLNAEQLEELHRRALELRRNWHSSYPIIRRSSQLVSFSSEGSGRRIGRMAVLSGRNGVGRWLVSLSGMYGRLGGVYTVRCWDLLLQCEGRPVCVAQKEFERFGGMAINRDNGTTSEGDHIAVLTPKGIKILSIVGNTTDPNDGFVISRTIPVPMSTLHYFQDRRVITMDSNGRLFLLDIDHPHIKVEFQHSIDRDPPTRDFILTKTFILILKRKTLELYPLPSSIAAVPRHIIIPPIFVYHWPWPVDYGVMTLRSSPFGIQSTNDPITMFIRFGSFTLPWSNNNINQYEIRPNSYFVSSELPSEMNVPYEYPPVLIGTIAAPVRMAKPTDLALGAYGTAIWLDSHAEMYYHDSGGQRVAGAYAQVERRRTLGVMQDDEEEEEQAAFRFDNSESREASFVFGYQHEESWNALTVDEEEGVIFLGRDSGVIDMFKYGT